MFDNIQEILTAIISKYNLLKSFGYTNEEIEKEIDDFKSKAELYSFSTNNIVIGKKKNTKKYKKQLIKLENLEKQYNLLIKKCEKMNEIFKDEITPIVQVKKLNL